MSLSGQQCSGRLPALPAASKATPKGGLSAWGAACAPQDTPEVVMQVMSRAVIVRGLSGARC